jgi:glycosyltransferase involved in cell wall biosynthesis
METGIADYSEVLISGLKEYFDVTLFVDNYTLADNPLYKEVNVKTYKDDRRFLDSFDFRIYNVGNNPQYHAYLYKAATEYPGLVILHDFVLYYLVVGVYQHTAHLYSKLYELGGSEALHRIKPYTKQGADLLECKHLAPLLPLNAELFNTTNKFMVHSNYTYNRVASKIHNPNRLRKINHVDLIGEQSHFIDRKTLFNKYNIPEDCLLLSSFGSIDKTKLNHIVCQTINALNKKLNRNLMYLLVGEGSYVDEYLSRIIRKTGYVDLAEFNSFIKHSDVVVNLRHPTMGETSGAVIRALGLGKPCIVSDDAWFSELPDDVVVKVQNAHIVESLHEAISQILDDADMRERLSTRARAYIKAEHGLHKISQEIVDFLNSDSVS